MAFHQILDPMHPYAQFPVPEQKLLLPASEILILAGAHARVEHLLVEIELVLEVIGGSRPLVWHSEPLVGKRHC